MSSAKRAGMSSPRGNWARSIRPNCIAVTRGPSRAGPAEPGGSTARGRRSGRRWGARVAWARFAPSGARRYRVGAVDVVGRVVAGQPAGELGVGVGAPHGVDLGDVVRVHGELHA